MSEPSHVTQSADPETVSSRVKTIEIKYGGYRWNCITCITTDWSLNNNYPFWWHYKCHYSCNYYQYKVVSVYFVVTWYFSKRWKDRPITVVCDKEFKKTFIAIPVVDFHLNFIRDLHYYYVQTIWQFWMQLKRRIHFSDPRYSDLWRKTI